LNFTQRILSEMSSWRNMMTPLNDKYQPQESTNSSLGHSKLLKSVSIKSTGNYLNNDNE